MATRKTTKVARTTKAADESGQMVALLRGINVGGNRKVPMNELRRLCGKLGWRDVTTYIQSGNIVFATDGDAAGAERALEAAIEQHFGFVVPVIVRPAASWPLAASRCPFDVGGDHAKFVHLGLAKLRIERGAEAALRPYCKAGERVVMRDDLLWIDYHEGVARSKLTPAVLDRVVGSTVTMRNWRSVAAIAGLLGRAGPLAGG